MPELRGKRPAKRPTKALTATAYHEAGHTVAAHMKRIRIGFVTIVPEGDCLGMCRTHFPSGFDPGDQSPRNQRLIENHIICFLAGQEAERAFRGWCSHVGAEQDRQSAIDLAMRVTGSSEELEAYLKWLSVKTRCLVKSPAWRVSIDAVAKALLEKRRLSPKDIKAVIFRAKPARGQTSE